jgi:lysophospholipase L1-like esterase
VAQWAGSGSSVTNAIVPKTDHTVTFDGAESVTIQPGSEVFSDPVVFPLPADSDLAVSFYIPRTSNIPATMHTFGNQTSYFALGNFAASITLPNALKDTVRPYLTGVDVDSTAASSLVVLGDSITDGTRSSANQNLRWTDDLARRLTSTFGDRVGVVNAGIAGNCVIGACLGPSMTDRFQRDVLSISGVKYLIILAGINDLVNTPGITAAMLAKAYNNLISQAHAQGILVYGATLTPFGGSKFFTQAREQLRQQVNTFIRAGGAFDAVIDFDKVIANPVNLAYIQPQFNADNVHPNDAGYQAMANAIDVTLLTRIPSLAGR